MTQRTEQGLPILGSRGGPRRKNRSGAGLGSERGAEEFRGASGQVRRDVGFRGQVRVSQEHRRSPGRVADVQARVLGEPGGTDVGLQVQQPGPALR